MVGLPARGKSYISKAIVRYLNFLGCPAQIFNAGNKRRQEGAAGVQANFFDAANLDAKAQRERMAMEAEREQARLDAVSAGSDKMIETLSRIAETSDDPQVAMEALRQLAELRKADVDAAKDAYRDD